MFIQTEETPNPLTLKFIPGLLLLQGDHRGQTFDFENEATAQQSPLALRLFQIDYVDRVFITEEYISITKAESISWDALKPHILSALMDHLLAQKPVVVDVDTSPAEEDITYSPQEQEIVDQIKELLDTRVRPAVAMDGGDIAFSKYVEGVVYLKMKGACSGCPSSSMTLKSGVESMLRHYVPEVTEVKQVNA